MYVFPFSNCYYYYFTKKKNNEVYIIFTAETDCKYFNKFASEARFQLFRFFKIYSKPGTASGESSITYVFCLYKIQASEYLINIKVMILFQDEISIPLENLKISNIKRA